jgi:hypothetical protein
MNIKANIEMEKINIKEEYKILQDLIKKASERLGYLRSICTHENIVEGNFSWRLGAVDKGMICEDCGAFLGSTSSNNMPVFQNPPPPPQSKKIHRP